MKVWDWDRVEVLLRIAGQDIAEFLTEWEGGSPVQHYGPGLIRKLETIQRGVKAAKALLVRERAGKA